MKEEKPTAIKNFRKLYGELWKLVVRAKNGGMDGREIYGCFACFEQEMNLFHKTQLMEHLKAKK